MTQDEFRLYWIPASTNLFGDKKSSHDIEFYRKLDNFLSVIEFERYSVSTPEEDKPMCDELRRKVVLLAGPHWRTVLKANKRTIKGINHATED